MGGRGVAGSKDAESWPSGRTEHTNVGRGAPGDTVNQDNRAKT